MTTTADEAAGTDEDSSGQASVRRARRTPWTLQRRLILTITAIVSFILVLVGATTSAVLGQVLEDQARTALESSIGQSARWLSGVSYGSDAADVLTGKPIDPGTLLALDWQDGAPTAAYVDEDYSVVALTDSQIAQVEAALVGSGIHPVYIDGVGSFNVVAGQVGPVVVGLGLSRDDVTATLGRMLTVIALLTAGGLILLAAATAWTVRAGLGPLRAVADTASRVSRLPLDRGAVTIDERVPPAESDPRTEVGQVGAALNTLLDHVDSSLDARQRNEERMRRFVADASHELRTPLASIRGYSELSLRALRTPSLSAAAEETTQQSLERIQAQSVRMTRLVEDLLLLARLDEGRELVYGAVDLSQLMIEAVGDAKAADEDHHWQIDVTDVPVLIAGDAARLHQVVANLLTNARTHTPAGSTVTGSVRQEGDGAVLVVHDDGPGVPEHLRTELFERFSRADLSRARQTGGSGLGLSIARAIVHAHHGEISVDSEPGSTSFIVRLPLARPQVPDEDQ